MVNLPPSDTLGNHTTGNLFSLGNIEKGGVVSQTKKKEKTWNKRYYKLLHNHNYLMWS